MINMSIENKAYYNIDGNFIMTQQLGIPDIQTKPVKLFVQAGEIYVIHPRALEQKHIFTINTTTIFGSCRAITSPAKIKWGLPCKC